MHPILFLLIATIFWGLNFHLAKVMLSQVSFVEAGFWRYLFGVGFLVILQWRSKQLWPGRAFRQAPKGVLLVGLIGLFAFNLLFFLGLQFTTALNAALIVSLNPVLTMIFASWMLGQPINNGQKLGMFVAVLGVFFLLSKGQLSNLFTLAWSRGDLLIVGANIVFALQNIWVRKYGSAFPNISFTLATNALCLLGFILLLPFVGARGIQGGDLSFWLAVFGIGVLGTGLAYLLWNEGIKRRGAHEAGLFMNIVPLAAALFAIFFGEQLHLYHLSSGGIILMGVLHFQRAGSKQMSQRN
jgi:drug/metabolite transporter (DMT)-like permease